MDLVAADRYVRKLERRAGPADKDRGGSIDALNAAIDVFAVGDHSNLTLEQTAAAGRRIARIADQVRAADRLPAARAHAANCKAAVK